MADEKSIIFNAEKSRRERLLKIDTFEDLKHFSKIRLRKKRSKKKFDKNPGRYLKEDVRRTWLATCVVAPIRMTLGYDSIARKIFDLEELPSPPAMTYEIREKYGNGQEKEEKE